MIVSFLVLPLGLPVSGYGSLGRGDPLLCRRFRRFYQKFVVISVKCDDLQLQLSHKGDAQMLIGLLRGAAAPGGAVEEADLEQIGLVDVL